MCPAGRCLLGQGVINKRLTLQLIMSLPPNPYPIEVFRCAHYPLPLIRKWPLPQLLLGRLP